MGLFRRRRPSSPPDPATAVAEFWTTWPSVRPRVEDAILTGSFDGIVDEVSARVSAIDPGLQWELAAGRVADHALVVSAGGKRSLRAMAERWMRAGPGADDMWEFHSSRQPDPTALSTST